MHLEIPLTLSPFGWAALQRRADSDGFELAEVAEQACAYYAAELGGDRTATKLPRSEASGPRDTMRSISLELEDGCAELLDREAERQGVPLERLVRHATLLYLADL